MGLRILRWSNVRGLFCYLCIFYLFILCACSRKLAKKDNPACNNAIKLQSPERLLGPRTPWVTCCTDNFQSNNMENNYVWPMETIEKTYFFVSAVSMLIEASLNQFKVVEPNVCANTIGFQGTPLSQFMSMEGPDQLVPKDEWMKASLQTSEKSRTNVFYLDVYEMQLNEESSCNLDAFLRDQFCYIISLDKRVNRISILTRQGSVLGPIAWSKLFAIIRLSPWAQGRHVTDDTVITIGLYGHWYRNLGGNHMLRPSNNRYGMIRPSEYFVNAAKQILINNNSQKVASGVVDTAIAWRIQKQFSAGTKLLYGKMRSEISFHVDQGGFIVGCQIGHLVKVLDRSASDDSPVALIFDIFANEGLGEDSDEDSEVGPTNNVKKQIVRALRRAFKKVVVVEAMLKKLDYPSLMLADPVGLSGKDRHSFITWLEAAIGSEARRLVHAGGHFAELIAELRNGLEVLDLFQPGFCSNSTALESGLDEEANDDISVFLFTKSGAQAQIEPKKAPVVNFKLPEHIGNAPRKRSPRKPAPQQQQQQQRPLAESGDVEGAVGPESDGLQAVHSIAAMRTSQGRSRAGNAASSTMISEQDGLATNDGEAGGEAAAGSSEQDTSQLLDGAANSLIAARPVVDPMGGSGAWDRVETIKTAKTFSNPDEI